MSPLPTNIHLTNSLVAANAHCQAIRQIIIHKVLNILYAVLAGEDVNMMYSGQGWTWDAAFFKKS